MSHRKTFLAVFAVLSLLLTSIAQAEPTVPVSEFLNSIGVNTSWPSRGQPIDKTIEMLKYTGHRWIRGGFEGVPDSPAPQLEVAKQTGVKFSWGLLSSSSDIPKLLTTAKPLHDAKALIAFEGNNEPNNWAVTYQGVKGGQALSWVPVANVQRDLYAAVKADAAFKDYPVWNMSNSGAQFDNCGLQFLTIPEGYTAALPAGTKYADFANVHNYMFHPNRPAPEDNKAWQAADPIQRVIDGLSHNYGPFTWLKRFTGYSNEQLIPLPRVTTETGCKVGANGVVEESHGKLLLNLYLAQFSRGWKYTAVYILRDRTDEAGNQAFGFYDKDYKPRLAAFYLHNLTTILADSEERRPHHKEFLYEIQDKPVTCHDVALQKKDGSVWIVVWSERVSGFDRVSMTFSRKQRIRVYDPTQGTHGIGHQKGDKVNLVLTDHPLIVEIR